MKVDKVPGKCFGHFFLLKCVDKRLVKDKTQRSLLMYTELFYLYPKYLCPDRRAYRRQMLISK